MILAIAGLNAAISSVLGMTAACALVSVARCAASAAERAVQHEVQRRQVRQLEPLHLAGAARAEVGFDHLRRDGLAEPVVVRRVASDQADVDGVAFVAGAAEAEVEELHSVGGSAWSVGKIASPRPTPDELGNHLVERVLDDAHGASFDEVRY